MGAICQTCKGDMSKVKGCYDTPVIINGKKHKRIKVGDKRDSLDTLKPDGRCGDCGAKTGHFHHRGCDLENCPGCGNNFSCCVCGQDYADDMMHEWY